MGDLVFRYVFTRSDGTKKRFDIHLDNETLAFARDHRDTRPAWTDLSFGKCPNCPLAEDEHPSCPVALNLSELVLGFADAVSHEKVHLEIETEARTYTKETTLQKGVSAVVGIVMVTSGCPILDKLRPMVRHHLPFASPDETQYRALSMYLLAQYFRRKRGLKADWDLKELARIYHEIDVVNRAFAKRLTAAASQDAVSNALAILNTFAGHISFTIDKDALLKLEKHFSPYLT